MPPRIPWAGDCHADGDHHSLECLPILSHGIFDDVRDSSVCERRCLPKRGRVTIPVSSDSDKIQDAAESLIVSGDSRASNDEGVGGGNSPSGGPFPGKKLIIGLRVMGKSSLWVDCLRILPPSVEIKLPSSTINIKIQFPNSMNKHTRGRNRCVRIVSITLGSGILAVGDAESSI